MEWLFPELNPSSDSSAKPRRILAHKNEESKVLKDLLAEELAKEENTDVAKDHLDRLDQCRLFFVIPLRHVSFFFLLYPSSIMELLISGY